MAAHLNILGLKLSSFPYLRLVMRRLSFWSYTSHFNIFCSPDIDCRLFCDILTASPSVATDKNQGSWFTVVIDFCLKICTVECMLCSVESTAPLCSIYCIFLQFTIHNTLFNTHCVVYIVYLNIKEYTLYLTLYSIHCAVYNIYLYNTYYTVHFTLCIIHCAVYIVYLCSTHDKLFPEDVPLLMAGVTKKLLVGLIDIKITTWKQT